jgi:hypothetical protein
MTENHPWQRRLKACGLTQRTLGRVLGYGESKTSRHLRGHLQSGVPQNVIAAIVAWELMTEEQRDLWVKNVVHEASEQNAPPSDETESDLIRSENQSLRRRIKELERKLTKLTDTK